MGTTGHCLCGKVQYEYTGAPILQALCHCRNCQLQSGSSYSMIQLLPLDALTCNGPVASHNDPSDSGNVLKRHYCSECGSPVYIRSAQREDIVIVNAGTLDDPATFVPQMNIWTKSAQPWVKFADGLPCHPENPT